MNAKPFWASLFLILAQCTGAPAYCDSLLLTIQLSDYDKNPDPYLQVLMQPVQEPYPSCDACDPELLNAAYNMVFSYQGEPPNQDHWKTPEEFYRDYGGDCEDFAIAKYHALKGKHNVKILTAYHYTKSGKVFGHAVVIMDGAWILDINPPYFYTYREFLEFWEPEFTIDSKGIQYVKVPHFSDED